MVVPSYREEDISKLPALQILINLGFTYLTPDEALELRGNKRGEVLLFGVLEKKLHELNQFQYKGKNYPFTDAAIHAAIESLRQEFPDGLIRMNERMYDLLTLPKSVPQTILGDTRSFDLKYVDWLESDTNAFHVTEEFSVERTGSHETRRPDIVLFVNGIPFAVIECKRPDQESIDGAVGQLLEYQGEEYIPKLFHYAQELLVINKNEAKYGTVGTPLKQWGQWKEQVDEKKLAKTINKPLLPAVLEKLFSTRPPEVRVHFEEMMRAERQVTEQDRILYGLCRPERLLEMTHRYIVYDAGEKKIARYQQVRVLAKLAKRIHVRNGSDRQGGVVWHSQGSGKSLTMVMLARAIALDPTIEDYKIVLVTDRVDLDDQIYKNFTKAGVKVEKAKTGADLTLLLKSPKTQIVTTIINKFEAAVSKKGLCIDSPNIFVLVDESHRSNYGELAAKMRKAIPHGCFIGFTGTPLIKTDKSTIDKFGGLIDAYPMPEAVADKAVVPLLYERRDVEQFVDKKTIDSWFERLTQGLTKEQSADLKKKFAHAGQLNKAEQKVRAIAWDIGADFRATWQGTGFKGQLVAPDKATAILYKRFLDEFGAVTSEVLISPPNEREGQDDVFEEPDDTVLKFWKAQMARHGNESAYQTALINSFLYNDEPEIIIVVSKLLTGFDAPRNVVLYLTKNLKSHTLLQAIARVNRVSQGKDFGYIIDYYGVLSELGNAMDLYGSLAEYDPKDLEGTLTDVSAEVGKLPQSHSDLWDIFKTIRNKRDAEEYEQLLQDEHLREDFYDTLTEYAKRLQIALATARFHTETPEKLVNTYKNDLKFFARLRVTVSRRYGQQVNFKEYDKRIQKLIDTHVGAGEVEKVTPLVNIFDQDAFAKEIEKVQGKAAKADTIAHRTAATIKERWDEDPVFYKRFSEMLEAVIEEFRRKRISDAEYLRRVTHIMGNVQERYRDDEASAFAGIIEESFGEYAPEPDARKRLVSYAAVKIEEIIRRNAIVDWTYNEDAKNVMRQEVDDFLFGLLEKEAIKLPLEAIDAIIEECINVAIARYK